jgi:hypothetical protein
MKIFYWLLIMFAMLLGATMAQAQEGPHRAGLVVRYGDGSVETACVSFPEEQISGVELLMRANLPLALQDGGIGAAVCKIGADGCDYPAEQCFCERDGPKAIYWAYYQREGAAWRYGSLGAGNTLVRDGDVHGWAWGAGDSSGGALPPLVELEAICGPAARPTLSAAPASRSTASAEPYPLALPTEQALPAPYPAPIDFYPVAPQPAEDQLMGGMGQLIGYGLFALLLLGTIGFVLWSKR